MDKFSFFSKLIWQGIVVFIVIWFRKAIMEFLGSLKEWREIKYKGIVLKREVEAGKAEPPEPTGVVPAGPILQLSDKAKMVISTLWKHQQEYYTDHSKGRWSFGVGLASPRYADYIIGVGETMLMGLVIISRQNGQSLLTDAGILFCQEHQDQLLPDWNFDRWRSL